MRRLIDAPRVTAMRRAIFLTLLFVLSVMSPLAAAATTETQFKDGSTAYEHTFSQKGTGAAGVITLPIGAAVQSASFDLLGEASTTTWTNFTSDSDYGGAGDTDYTSSTTTRPSPFTYARRDNFEVDTETVTLKGNPTELTPRFSSSSSVATLGSAHLNTTGQFVALSDQGYTSPTKQFADIRASTSTPWGYTGVVVPINSSEIHILRYSSQYMTNNPSAIMRVNPSTGQYLGTASYLTNSCGSNAMYGIHDVDVYNGNVYTAHYTYYKINKWSVGWNTQGTQVQWSCQTSYTYNYPNYITGVDFDDNTGKMYIGVYDASTRNHYLKEVNPSSPTVITGTWLMTSTSYYYDHGAGLTVNMPNVMYNIYYMNTDYKSIHYHYTMSSGLLVSQGERTMPGGGHYGLTDTDEHKVMFSCHWSGTNYCTQGIRKVHVYGDGAHYDPRASSLTSQTIVGQTTSISKAINSINVNGIFGSVPAGTSINVDVSNDGGVTWKSGYVGQKVNFANAGTSVKWRATLNGTTTKTPVLGDVVLTYTTNYQTSGYYYAYQYVGTAASNVIAATVDWNETRPSGTSITVNVGYKASSSTCGTGGSGVQSFTSPNTTKSMTATSSYYCVRIMLSTSSTGATPSLTDLSIMRCTPMRPINPASTSTVRRLGSARPPTGRSSVRSPCRVNKAATPWSTNSTTPFQTPVPVPLTFQSTSRPNRRANCPSPRLRYVYTMQTVNLDLVIPEDEILHERITPYEVVSRHVIGEAANSMVSADLTLMTAGSAANWPTISWQYGDVFPDPNDPAQYIDVDPTSYSVESNGILEIHWKFFVTSEMPDQDNVRFRVGCLDDSGTAGFAPEPLTSAEGLRVNRSFGLGWLNVRDNDGELTSQDVPDGAWVAAGEQVYFVGAMWFQDTEDAPKDSAFDVRISRNGYVESTARDTTNNNGSFFIPIDLPNIDVPDGLTYEVQTYNERNPDHVQQPNSEWRRTYLVDATHPERKAVAPVDDAYEAATNEQAVQILVEDKVGHPMELELNYWVEADHDANRNGEADPEEYVSKTVTNTTEARSKWFITNIDTSRNPNMGRVSYYWDGGDQAGNPLHFTAMNDDDELLKFEASEGFLYDDATFRTRKDSSAVFTGLEWVGHEDNEAVFAGMEQTISLGFIDANTAIDFEFISLVFDFEGPNPAQRRPVHFVLRNQQHVLVRLALHSSFTHQYDDPNHQRIRSSVDFA